MRHLYRCPLRWADLDLLGHINNVVYVDYLQEARVDMLRRHAPSTRRPGSGEGLVVARHDITYVLPLHYRDEPVSIECWVTEVRAASFTMAYEIFDETPQGRVVYLRATTVLTPFVFAANRPRRLHPEEKQALAPFLQTPGTTSRPDRFVDGLGPAGNAGPFDSVREVPVRFSDVDVYGHVNNVEYLTYLQESRIPMMTELGRSVPGGEKFRMVVAATSMDYKVAMVLREEPYVATSRITRVGTKSVWIETALHDGVGPDALLCARGRAVMVFFDTGTGHSVEPSAEVRAVLAARVAGTPGSLTPGS